MTHTLGLIGSGMIGSALARLAVAAGLDVVVSNSRGPDSLAELVSKLGGQTRAATPADAAQAGDLVVATLPLSAYRHLPVAALAGKTVIDTMNYYPDRDGRIAELDDGSTAGPALTSSTLIQQHLPESRVVKAFNSIDFHRLAGLARPSGALDRSALPIAGNHPEATSQVTRLLNTLGYDAVDLGSLAESWRSQPGAPVYVTPYLGPQPHGLTQEQTQGWFFDTPGVPVPAGLVEQLLAAAAAARLPQPPLPARRGDQHV
ncbi:NADPH-dependent F420 reductase [Allobranchiibius sp. CTAmp26]|uniref:NADPH-dependent F420 reductase n=1 Tax=Allobranchiibius sp. CTAmp26 TaxID=2815214 RepID=UPI001AA16EBC|nr:NAD(P)-binding domain-containing protein [Allobranchiibius sp. CTAmp26]MBO1756951.1 NAD(P)-binding domain-containing protein [Allobranchiibius sp. CTAmp26]